VTAKDTRPLTTFLRTFVDMKSAQRSQAYRAFAHDYRRDLAPFVSAVYDLPATNEQMTRVARALEERETARLWLFAPPVPPAREQGASNEANPQGDVDPAQRVPEDQRAGGHARRSPAPGAFAYAAGSGPCLGGPDAGHGEQGGKAAASGC
jgi:hypothetical protein